MAGIFQGTAINRFPLPAPPTTTNPIPYTWPFFKLNEIDSRNTKCVTIKNYNNNDLDRHRRNHHQLQRRALLTPQMAATVDLTKTISRNSTTVRTAAKASTAALTASDTSVSTPTTGRSRARCVRNASSPKRTCSTTCRGVAVVSTGQLTMPNALLFPPPSHLQMIVLARAREFERSRSNYGVPLIGSPLQ